MLNKAQKNFNIRPMGNNSNPVSLKTVGKE